MERIPLAIIGCGGMGHRHLFGLTELQRAGLSPFELVAVCDVVEDSAVALAATAEDLLGTRPATTTDVEALPGMGVVAVDITSTPRYHHSLGIDAVRLGLHAMIEKPVGLTIAACHALAEAAGDSDRVVSISENFRRDPVNRLAKALLDGGALGDPRYMIHNFAGGGNLMAISVWRHQKNESGILLDVGTHYTDIMEYFLGEITSVYAQMRLFEPRRYNPAASGGEPTSDPGGVYGASQALMPAEFEATADDAVFATVNFASGVVGQFIENHAEHGRGYWQRQVHGSRGSIHMPRDRSGRSLTLTSDQGSVCEGDALLECVPGFHLDDVTAALFGGDRLATYDFSFNDTDRKLIAVEYADFGRAVLEGGRPEVGIAEGTRAVAVTYAMLESGAAGGQVVAVDDLVAGRIRDYQRSIDDVLGLA